MKRISIIFLILYTLLSIYSLAILIFNWKFPLILTPITTICGFVFSLFYGAFHLGWKRILILGVSCFIIALVMESVGVATGLVYGPYHYTARLGPKFLGLVPYIIPAAWFMMMYPSLVIAARILRTPDPDGWKVPAVAALGGIIMTAWDLVMDPIMVLGGNWIWDGSGWIQGFLRDPGTELLGLVADHFPDFLCLPVHCWKMGQETCPGYYPPDSAGDLYHHRDHLGDLSFHHGFGRTSAGRYLCHAPMDGHWNDGK